MTWEFVLLALSLLLLYHPQYRSSGKHVSIYLAVCTYQAYVKVKNMPLPYQVDDIFQMNKVPAGGFRVKKCPHEINKNDAFSEESLRYLA